MRNQSFIDLCVHHIVLVYSQYMCITIFFIGIGILCGEEEWSMDDQWIRTIKTERCGARFF